MDRKPVIVIGPMNIPADSPACKVLSAWRLSGRLLKDLVNQALIAYGETDEYKKAVKEACDGRKG